MNFLGGISEKATDLIIFLYMTWLWESAQELVSTRQFRADLSLILLFYINEM